jgi:DNA segregation ATPase FtsK/SpoIIIE-like protein
MRELKIGYIDATGIIREMEKRGVVSTPVTPYFGWKVLPISTDKQ